VRSQPSRWHRRPPPAAGRRGPEDAVLPAPLAPWSRTISCPPTSRSTPASTGNHREGHSRTEADHGTMATASTLASTTPNSPSGPAIGPMPGHRARVAGKRAESRGMRRISPLPFTSRHDATGGSDGHATAAGCLAQLSPRSDEDGCRYRLSALSTARAVDSAATPLPPRLGAFLGRGFSRMTRVPAPHSAGRAWATTACRAKGAPTREGPSRRRRPATRSSAGARRSPGDRERRGGPPRPGVRGGAP